MNNNQRELLHRLFQLSWLLRRHALHHHREHGPHASPYQGQGRILALLKLKPEMSQKELSTILDIRSQSLGELLVKLEKSGYITRVPSETDKRAMVIRLTEEGRAAAEAVPGEENEDASFFHVLTAEEQDSLADYLDRLIASLEKDLGPEPEERFGRPEFRGRGFGPPRGPHHHW